MNILILGDIVGPSGREAIINKLPNIIKKKKIDFVIVNGENSADSGVGITKENTEEFFKAGADVITTGNHVWDQKETMEYNTSEKKRVLSITRYSDQIWAAGSNSTEGMIIEAAGGINAAAESGIKGNMTTSLEGLIEMDPEIIIITQPRESGGDEFLEDLVTIKVTQEIPAVLNNKIYFMETKHFTTLSFWNIRGIEELAKLLWPEDIGAKSFGGFSLP